MMGETAGRSQAHTHTHRHRYFIEGVTDCMAQNASNPLPPQSANAVSCTLHMVDGFLHTSRDCKMLHVYRRCNWGQYEFPYTLRKSKYLKMKECNVSLMQSHAVKVRFLFAYI